MTEEEIMGPINANINATSAVAILLRHVVYALSQQPQIDRELLKKHLEALPVPSGSLALVDIYQGLQEKIIQDLEV